MGEPLLELMRKEHSECADADTPFLAQNYYIKTSSRVEVRGARASSY